MLGQVRKHYEKIIDKLVKPVVKYKIPPNFVTILSIPLALIAAYFISKHDWSIALIVMVFSIIIDNIDGAIARAEGRVTKWGSYLDYMMDKHVELILFVGFAFAGYPILSIIAASLNMLNSVAKPALAIRIPLGNEDWPAIGERADRLLVMIGGVFLSLFYPSILGHDTIAIMLAIFSIMCFIGEIQRMIFAKKLIENYKKTRKKQMIRH